MAVRKRGKKWFIDYYIGERRFRKIVQCDKKEALNIERDLLTKRDRGELGLDDMLVSPKSAPILFKDFAEEYLAWSKKNKEPETHRRKECHVKILLSHFGEKMLTQIDTRDVENFKDERKASKVNGRAIRPATVNRDLETLRHMFNMAIKWKKAKKNSVREGKEGIDFLPIDEKPTVILEDSQEEALLEVARRSRNRSLVDIITLALDTGLRQADILSLTWEEVNLKERLITKVMKKTKKVVSLRMTERLYETLKALRGFRVPPPTGYLFPGKKEGTHLKSCSTSWRTARKNASAVLKKSGLRGIEKLRFHDNRHTFGSRLAAEGVDLNTVKELMGHKYITTTERYLHSSDPLKTDAIQRLDNRHKRGTEKKEAIS